MILAIILYFLIKVIRGVDIGQTVCSRSETLFGDVLIDYRNILIDISLICSNTYNASRPSAASINKNTLYMYIPCLF
ncbi:hypothetical protein AZ044_003097 [Pluralibacter gergoviae]|nr:hypothetical protein AZ034_001819 [Pluralibacter gergoviae]OUF56830.1 hypothetical protein AZ044_003097 [Pluralibacter gergoviae]